MTARAGRLSPTEHKVLQLLCSMKVKEVAVYLGNSQNTISTHLSRAKVKFVRWKLIPNPHASTAAVVAAFLQKYNHIEGYEHV